MHKLAYMSDQEIPLRALLDKVVVQLGREELLEHAVPGASPVWGGGGGGSASNGKAERAIPDVEDQRRTLNMVLEWQAQRCYAIDAPVMHRLIEHVGTVVDLFKVHEHGETAYEATHGKRYAGMTWECGERVLFGAPKRKRVKLEPRWNHGACIGTSFMTGEHCVARPGGSISRSRPLRRIVERLR